MTEINIPLLRKAVEWAEAEAAKPDQTMSRWYQGAWVVSPQEINRSPECGTCFCIAGYIASITLHPGEHLRGDVIADVDENYVDHVAPRAERELGVIGTLDDLFHGQNTIEDVRRLAEELAGESL